MTMTPLDRSAGIMVGLADIAERLRTPPQVVAGWHYFDDTLPAPDGLEDSEPVWQWGSIQAWDAERQRVKTVAAAARPAEASAEPPAKAAVHHAPYPDPTEANSEKHIAHAYKKMAEEDQ